MTHEEEQAMFFERVNSIIGKNHSAILNWPLHYQTALSVMVEFLIQGDKEQQAMFSTGFAIGYSYGLQYGDLPDGKPKGDLD